MAAKKRVDGGLEAVHAVKWILAVRLRFGGEPEAVREGKWILAVRMWVNGVLEAVHAVKRTLAVRMRVVVLELLEERKKLFDTLLVAVDLDRPRVRLFESLVILIEDFLFNPALAPSEKRRARRVEAIMEFDPEASACAIERT